MVVQLPSFPFLITILLISLTVVLKRVYKLKAQSLILPLPPGPSKLPIIGSIHHLLSSLPHRALRDLARKHGPLMLLRLGQVDHIVVSSPEAAQEIIKTHDINFASRPIIYAADVLSYGYADIVFSPYGSSWRHLRKLCMTELFTLRRVKSFNSMRKEEIFNLVKDISLNTEAPINLSSKLMALSNDIVSRAVFGNKCRHQRRFLVLMKEAMMLVSGFCIADLFPSLKFVGIVSGMKIRTGRIHRQLNEIIEEIIREHEMKAAAAKKGGQHEPEEEDLVDVLLRIMDHGESEIPITINNIKGVILDLFAGGTDTSSSTLGWAMAELTRNPKTMEKAQQEVRRVLRGRTKVEESDIDELKFISLVIKETLRLHPPLPLLIPRVCKESCPVQGYMVPGGSRVIVNAWALGRDPKYWVNAEKFRPERFDGSSMGFKGTSFEFIPFGAGRRMCPGMTFGLANMELALAQLLFSFDWELPHGMKPEDMDMTEIFGLTTPRKSALKLIATPYAPIPLD